MALGIDTADPLNNSCFNWPNFYSWMGHWPVFVGRYFGGGYDSSAGEFTYFKKATGGVANSVAPIQASQASRQSTGGSTGYGYGQTDAGTTIKNINNFLASGELVKPSSGLVYVYLDVEANTNITADYWAGWANAIWHATDPSGALPYYPCVYTQFTESGGKYYPQSSVQSALNSACTNYPNIEVQCFGLWSNEPEPYSFCSPSATPDWSVFGTFQQDLCGTYVSVPVLLYQYAENCGCIVGGGYTGFAGASNCSNFTACDVSGVTHYYANNNLDLDGNDNTGANSYMLSIA